MDKQRFLDNINRQITSEKTGMEQLAISVWSLKKRPFPFINHPPHQNFFLNKVFFIIYPLWRLDSSQYGCLLQNQPVSPDISAEVAGRGHQSPFRQEKGRQEPKAVTKVFTSLSSHVESTLVTATDLSSRFCYHKVVWVVGILGGAPALIVTQEGMRNCHLSPHSLL